MRACLVGLVYLALISRSEAQPSGVELYDQAQKEMEAGKYEDAARDYAAAFDVTKDPVLYFKIATAYDKAGNCANAAMYYGLYLEKAKPDAQNVAVAKERQAACQPKTEPAVQAAPAPPPAEPAPAAPAASEPAPPAAEPPAEPVPHPSKSKDAAWLLVGGSLAFVTAGAVLAYSANSSEQDVRDLYVSNNGMPPVFDDKTKQRYDDLVAEGHYYQYLSWASFGLATGCAVGAAVMFWRDANADDTVSVVPVVAPHRAGIAATLRF